MIIKGKLAFTDDGHLPENVSLDIPDAALNDIIDARLRERVSPSALVVLAGESLARIGAPTMQEVVDLKYPMTPPPEERSCETCKHEKISVEEEPCNLCNQLKSDGYWEPKPTPQAPEDALARARACYNADLPTRACDFFESAIVEEQARTERIKHDLTEVYKKELDDLTRRLEETETRIGVAEADRNHEIELREELERKLAEAWTDYLVNQYARYRKECFEYSRPFRLAHDWIAARREERKKKQETMTKEQLIKNLYLVKTDKKIENADIYECPYIHCIEEWYYIHDYNMILISPSSDFSIKDSSSIENAIKGVH
jgi:hypothetical protein